MGPDPKHNMKPTEDFLFVVLCAHVIAAAQYCKESSNDVNATADEIVEVFVKISSPTESEASFENDGAYNYVRDLLTMLLVWHGFHDAVREGDGDRILLYWKVLLPIFQQEGHYNYAKEAFLIIANSKTLSERQSTELLWSRTVNTHGRQGCNIPFDLHMEHLNRRLKYMIENLGPNAQPRAIERVAKSLGIVSHVCQIFEVEAEVTGNKGYCSYPCFEKDLEKILQQLKEEQVFTVNRGRALVSYNNRPLLASLKWQNIMKWVKSKLLNLQVH